MPGGSDGLDRISRTPIRRNDQWEWNNAMRPVQVLVVFSLFLFMIGEHKAQNERFPIIFSSNSKDTVGIMLGRAMEKAIDQSFHLRPGQDKEPHLVLTMVSREIRSGGKSKRSPIQPMSVIGLVWSAKTDPASPLIYVDMMVDTCSLSAIRDYTKTVEVETLKRLNWIRLSFK